MKIKQVINGLNAQRYESDSQIWRNTISAILYPDTATAMSWGIALTGECCTGENMLNILLTFAVLASYAAGVHVGRHWHKYTSE